MKTSHHSMFFQDWSFFNNTKHIKKVNFKHVLSVQSNLSETNIIINTLSVNEQNCLIEKTLLCDFEEKVMNELLSNGKIENCHIVVYGKNCNDITVEKKCKQLVNLGVGDVCVYQGGMFEWCLLQDVFGDEMFKTTQKVKDVLSFI